MTKHITKRADDAEARVRELEEALREIDGWLYHATEGGGMKSARKAFAITRAVLEAKPN